MIHSMHCRIIAGLATPWREDMSSKPSLSSRDLLEEHDRRHVHLDRVVQMHSSTQKVADPPVRRLISAHGKAPSKCYAKEMQDFEVMMPSGNQNMKKKGAAAKLLSSAPRKVSTPSCQFRKAIIMMRSKTENDSRMVVA